MTLKINKLTQISFFLRTFCEHILGHSQKSAGISRNLLCWFSAVNLLFQCSSIPCLSMKKGLVDARVRQLTRTELAWRVESAQCLRSPHSLTKLVGAPIDGYGLEVISGTCQRIWWPRTPTNLGCAWAMVCRGGWSHLACQLSCHGTSSWEHASPVSLVG